LIALLRFLTILCPETACIERLRIRELARLHLMGAMRQHNVFTLFKNVCLGDIVVEDSRILGGFRKCEILVNVSE
jgi:hypothetical protein